MRRICAGLVCAGVLIGPPWLARADDPPPAGDLARAQLSRVLAVLQLRPEAAGQSCLDALREVHQTEAQVKILQNQAKSPDLPIAADVLETDYENGNEICGADAARVCAAPGANVHLVGACAALHSTR